MCGLLSQACKLLGVSPERMQNDLDEFLDEPVTAIAELGGGGPFSLTEQKLRSSVACNVKGAAIREQL